MKKRADERLISSGEAAERLGRHPKTILRMIASGRIRAVRIGGCWMIAESAVDLLRQLAGAVDNMRATSTATASRRR